MLFSAFKKCIEYLFNIGTLYRLPRRRAPRRAYLLLTPQYLNYGDQALAAAAIETLKKHLPACELVEINYSFYTYWPERFKAQVRPQDLLLFAAGGYMGDLWPESQALVNDILRAFPENTTVILPQSIYFAGGEDCACFREMRTLFAGHRDLWVFLREEHSYRCVTQKLMPEKKERCFLVPDLAMLLSPPEQRLPRNGVLFVFRDDSEKVLPQTTKNELAGYCRGKGLPVKKATMMIRHVEIPIWLRPPFLRYKWRQFGASRLVVTDRLHGMLFAYITGTPCLAFDNISRKVGGVHAWIGDDRRIRLAGEDWASQLDALIAESGAAPERNRDVPEAKFAPLWQLLEQLNGKKNGARPQSPQANPSR